MPDRPGCFIISFDLELAWGSWSRQRFSMETFAAGADAARRIDDLCARLEVPATWAVVGALRGLSPGDLEGLAGEASVGATRPDLGPYNDPLPSVELVRRHPDAFFAPDLVEQLLTSSASHEIAGHTFFHAVPTTADGMVADLAACSATLDDRAPLETIVYPRDAIGHVQALERGGIRQYRGTGSATYLAQGKPRGWGRVQHTLDQAVGRPASLVTIGTGSPTCVPSSAVLTLRYGLRRRIPRGRLHHRFLQPLETAAATGGTYHLWTHPWNLAIPGSDAWDLLEAVLERAVELRAAGSLEVATIGQAAATARAAASP